MILNFDFNLLEDYEIDGVDPRDYPDFCDAYLAEGVYNGRYMTIDECDWFTETYPEWIWEQAFESLIP